MSNGHDRRAVSAERKRTKRWETTPEKRAQYLAALDAALTISLQRKNARDIRGCVETMKSIESQNQTDEHLQIKNDRLDRGDPTENISHTMTPDQRQRAEEIVSRRLGHPVEIVPTSNGVHPSAHS